MTSEYCREKNKKTTFLYPYSVAGRGTLPACTLWKSRGGFLRFRRDTVPITGRHALGGGLPSAVGDEALQSGDTTERVHLSVRSGTWTWL